MNRREFVERSLAISAMAGSFTVGGVNPVREQETKVAKPGLPGSHTRHSKAVPDGIVRVVTVCQEGLKGKSLINDTLERLDQAASFRPDIACLPEDFTRGEPEALTGPTVQRVGK